MPNHNLHAAAILEAAAQGHGDDVMAEIHEMIADGWKPPIDDEPIDKKKAAKVKAWLLARAHAKLDKLKAMSKALESFRVPVEMHKANEDRKEYQGRDKDGHFGTGKGGAKEQELRERDSAKPPQSALHKIYGDYDKLSHQEISQKVTDHLGKMPKEQVAKEIMAFGIHGAKTRKEAIEMATRKITERKESAERTAEIGAKPLKTSATSLPPEVSPKISHKQTGERHEFQGINPASPPKMSMVHGKKDEMSAGLEAGRARPS